MRGDDRNVDGKPKFTNAARPPRGILDPVIALQLARGREGSRRDPQRRPQPRSRGDADQAIHRLRVYRVLRGFVCRVGAACTGGGRDDGAICGMARRRLRCFRKSAILRIVDVPLSADDAGDGGRDPRPSLAKWSLTWIALAIFAAQFWRLAGWLPILIGVLFGLAVMIGVSGLFDNAALMAAGIAMAVGLAVMASMAAGPRRLRSKFLHPWPLARISYR